MLQKIRLINFKCFEDQALDCAPLTLLCGLNGMGKSSVIQALLVLRQSFASGELRQGRLVLGGELAELGTGQDVLCENADPSVVGFELHHTDISEPCVLSFDYSSESDRLQAKDAQLWSGHKENGREAWESVPPFGGTLTYLDAERIGPRKAYSLSETSSELGNLGARGEYAWNYLMFHQNDLLSSDDLRCHPQHGGERLLDVIGHWLQEVSPGVRLRLDPIKVADAVVAGFSFERLGDIDTRSYRSTNVGFGISYVLPVLVGLLAMPRGTLCLIENPEAHLHPRGQTQLAELTVRASLSGIQVVVETHSDHFLDGIRIAVRDKLIGPEQVAIHYFDRDEGKSKVFSPKLDSDGRIDAWPKGFFDQHETNLARLLAPKS